MVLVCKLNIISIDGGLEVSVFSNGWALFGGVRLEARLSLIGLLYLSVGG